MNIQYKVIIFLALLSIGQFIYKGCEDRKVENEKLELRNTIATKDSINKEKDSSYSRLSLQYNSQSELAARLKLENASLANDIKKKDEEIAYLLSIKIKPDTVFVNNTNTLLKDSIAYFKGYTKPFNVSGEFHLKDTTTRKLNVLMDEFKLVAVETKLENGFYRARIKFTDLQNNTLNMFKVQELTSAINTQDSKENVQFLSFGIGGNLSLKALSIGSLLNIYEKNVIMFNYELFRDNAVIIDENKWYNRINIGYYRILF